MIAMSATAAKAHAASTIVLSTGDVRIAWHPDLPPACARSTDQPYQAPQGRAELREAIAAYSGPGVAPDQVLVCAGARQALLLAFAAIAADRRAEILLPAPYWPSYLPLAELAGLRPVVVPGKPGRIDAEALRAAAGPSTGAVVINSPRNPDGAVLDREVLSRVTAWSAAAGIRLVFDQVYRGVPLPGDAAPSPLDMPKGLPEHCVVVDGLSKSHALAGLRIGWTIASRALTDRMCALASHIIGGTSSCAQDVALAALAADGAQRTAIGAMLAANRGHAAARLALIPGVGCARPAGGIFLFPDLTGWLGDHPIGHVKLVPWLLERHALALVDGGAFGAPGFLRLSYAVEPQLLRAGIERLGEALTGARHD